MAQQGPFDFALAVLVSVAGCTFGSSVGDGAGGSGTGPSSSGSQGGGQDEDTAVGISGTAGSTGMLASTGDSDGDTGTSTSSGTTTDGDTSGSTTSAALSCDELFMAAPGYVLCGETRDTCLFNASTNGRTCDEMCMWLGSECEAAFDNPGSAGQECDVNEPNGDTCTTERDTEICECRRP